MSTTGQPVSGIYQIRNRHTGRVYIGKSRNVHGRWLAHRAALERGLHINDELQGDWQVYGVAGFEFTILEVVSGLEALWNAEARHLATADDTYNAAPVYEVRERHLMPGSPINPEQLVSALLDITLPDCLVKAGVHIQDYAEFLDAGYRGLYAGETARDIAARKGLAKSQHILDWMGADELAANLFRASLAEQRLRQGDATNKAEANQVHHATGAAVRRVIIEQGATVPEQLPTPQVSIQELQRREQQRIEAERQPSLFPDPDEASDKVEGER